jgi:GT2 family glycosyltransferase
MGEDVELPCLDILVVNFNTGYLLHDMFAAVAASQDVPQKRFLCVDNASSDDSLQIFSERYPDVYLEENQVNTGFGRANNQLLPQVRGDFVLLLNTDAFVAPDTLAKTIDYMRQHPECGVLGVRLVGRDGTLQPSCRYFPTPFNLFLVKTGLAWLFPWVRLVDDMNWDHASVRECDWVPGCYYLIRREALDQVGLFDPRYFLYCEEVDHCRRIKQAGWKVVYYPDTQVVHIGGESAKSAGKLSDAGRQLSALQVESELLYFRKHNGVPGVVAYMGLVLLGDAILAAKHVLKQRGKALASCWNNHKLVWRLLRATRLGTAPTR